MKFCSEKQNKLILIFIAIFLTFFLFYSQNYQNKVDANSNLKRNSSNSISSSSFSYSTSTSKLVKDLYETGHLIANTNLCPAFGKYMKLMILVTSALDHIDARMAIRQTWSFYGRHHNVGVGFVVGSYKQPSQNAIIQEEHHTYGDLIQARIVDSYNNLTLKTISILEWVDTYCSQVPFVLKTDDDMFINIPLLLIQLEKQQQAKRSIFGQIARKWTPSREKMSKYFLDKSEFEPDIFPDFVTGPAYTMTQDSVHDLYHQALTMPFIKLEDVFITGCAAASIGIRLINVEEYHSRAMPLNITQTRKTISIHGITPKEQFLLWTFILHTR